MRVIAVANQKGGCGKTTVSIHLAGCLSLLGKRVMLIDLDPQGHASLGLGVPIEELSDTLYDVFDETRVSPLYLQDVCIPVLEGCDLVPSELSLSAIEQKLAGVPDRENKLLQKIEALDTPYDFILIDCPPSLGLLTFNALRAAKETIIPIESSFFSLHGLSRILETIKFLGASVGHFLTVHMLLNAYDPRSPLSGRIHDGVQRLFPNHLFKAVIRESVDLREAASQGEPIHQYNEMSIAFEDFMNLTGELMGREEFREPLPAYDAAELSIPLSASSQGVSGNGHKTNGEGEKRDVLFSYRAFGVSSVQLAGDFNHWVATDLMAPIKEGGAWRKLFHLDHGIYKYKFIVDGEWVTDPQNPQVILNPFGGQDSVIEV